MNAKELRKISEDAEQIANVKRNPLYIIGDNLFDTFNISGLFRLADALSIKELILCGVSETPPNPKITKYSVGTHKVVPWSKFETAEEAILNLKNKEKDIVIASVELTDNSILYTNTVFPKNRPVAIIVGNETNGISQSALELSDLHLKIQMYGLNNSLNVVVATSIIGYHIASNLGFK